MILKSREVLKLGKVLSIATECRYVVPSERSSREEYDGSPLFPSLGAVYLSGSVVLLRGSAVFLHGTVMFLRPLERLLIASVPSLDEGVKYC
jgi:hypothetical protein